jgi:hypothetical protein
MGLTFLVGARKGWRWLVDPPKSTWFWYSQALVKAIAGARFLRVWTYVFGVIFVVVGLMNISGAVTILVCGAR